MSNIFIHHVFFWLKEPNNVEHKAQLKAALYKLATVETIQSAHIGVPAATNRPVIDASYTFSMLSIFKNQSDQDTYQTHPIHLEFVEKNQHLWEKVVVYDTIDANWGYASKVGQDFRIFRIYKIESTTKSVFSRKIAKI